MSITKVTSPIKSNHHQLVEAILSSRFETDERLLGIFSVVRIVLDLRVAFAFRRHHLIVQIAHKFLRLLRHTIIRLRELPVNSLAIASKSSTVESLWFLFYLFERSRTMLALVVVLVDVRVFFDDFLLERHVIDWLRFDVMRCRESLTTEQQTMIDYKNPQIDRDRDHIIQFTSEQLVMDSPISCRCSTSCTASSTEPLDRERQWTASAGEMSGNISSSKRTSSFLSTVSW